MGAVEVGDEGGPRKLGPAARHFTRCPPCLMVSSRWLMVLESRLRGSWTWAEVGTQRVRHPGSGAPFRCALNPSSPECSSTRPSSRPRLSRSRRPRRRRSRGPRRGQLRWRVGLHPAEPGRGALRLGRRGGGGAAAGERGRGRFRRRQPISTATAISTWQSPSPTTTSSRFSSTTAQETSLHRRISTSGAASTTSWLQT